MKVETLTLDGKNSTNEDRLSLLNMKSNVLAVTLADGMGGLSLGDVAADVITNAISQFLQENYHGSEECYMLHQALKCADDRLKCVSIEKKSNMGAAVSIAIVREKQLHCTWQGNVRVYVSHQGELKLLTTDHIADIGYGKTALTRCLKGAGLRANVPYLCHQLATSDMIFICTDGMYKISEEYLGKLSLNEIKDKIDVPQDDATMIQITVE